MKIVKGETGQAVVNGVSGFLDGLALNYLWEGYKLPGYGKPLVNLGTFQDKTTGEQFTVSIGQDDVIQSSIFAVEAIVGGVMKNSNLMYRGIGGVVGTLATKGFEMTGVAIKPDPPVERIQTEKGDDGVYRASQHQSIERGWGH